VKSSHILHVETTNKCVAKSQHISKYLGSI